MALPRFLAPIISESDNPRRIAKQYYARKEASMAWRCRKGNETFQSLATVRDAHASPDIADLLIVDHRVIDLDSQTQYLRREAAHSGQKRIRRDDAIALRSHQANARVDQRLLGVK